MMVSLSATRSKKAVFAASFPVHFSRNQKSSLCAARVHTRVRVQHKGEEEHAATHSEQANACLATHPRPRALLLTVVAFHALHPLVAQHMHTLADDPSIIVHNH